MKVMVIGGGAREHAVIKGLKKSHEIDAIYCLPGNGGIAKDAITVNIGATNLDEIVAFALKKGIGYAVVTPDDPLVLGLVDKLEAVGVPCFGPSKAAAIIEGSKVFSKELMKKYGIPTAEFEAFKDSEEALAYIEKASYPLVIKADGLALGKGVLICQDKQEARNAIQSIMLNKVFGDSGNEIVIEEFLEGPELSLLTFTDGKTIKPMVTSMDHKRALDGDLGLNTGGMGTIAPNPFYTKEIEKECMERILIPTVRAMRKEARPFKGCLYFGLMLTKNGVKVIEYNCRFGDPEAEVVLPLLNTDLFTVMRAVTEERLDSITLDFADKQACCVMLASGGYPEKYTKGYPITYPQDIAENIYFAGVAEGQDGLVTSGGRVLGVTAVADTLEEAVRKAYGKADKISFENRHMRRDIGKKAIDALKQ